VEFVIVMIVKKELIEKVLGFVLHGINRFVKCVVIMIWTVSNIKIYEINVNL